MKRYRCPQCGESAPARLYDREAAQGKLRCYQCSTPDKPVYIIIEDDQKKVPA